MAIAPVDVHTRASASFVFCLAVADERFQSSDPDALRFVARRHLSEGDAGLAQPVQNAVQPGGIGIGQRRHEMLNREVRIDLQ